jgi:hypothetical protein
VLGQAVREMLLAQSSDAAESGTIDDAALSALEERDTLFPALDLRVLG